MKKTISLLLAFVMLFNILFEKIGVSLLSVSATEIISIESASDLSMFAARVNRGEKTINAVLTNNIDLSSICNESVNWEPIKGYRGVFEGNNFTISNLYFDGTEDSDAGLFTDLAGTCKNVQISNVFISNGMNMGAICGISHGRIINCHVLSGTIKGSKTFASSSGGICGKMEFAGAVGVQPLPMIENCSNNAKIESYLSNIGGICGVASGANDSNCSIINNCRNLGSISSYGSTCITGGIVGSCVCATISECFNTGPITINRFSYSGGIVGAGNLATLENSYNTGTITTDDVKKSIIIADDGTGGIVGRLDGSHKLMVANCFNIGSVSAYRWSGGIVGRNAEDSINYITNCYYLADCATDGADVSQNGMGCVQNGKKVLDNLLSVVPVDHSQLLGLASALNNNGNKWVDNEETGHPILINNPEVEVPVLPIITTTTNSTNDNTTKPNAQITTEVAENVTTIPLNTTTISKSDFQSRMKSQFNKWTVGSGIQRNTLTISEGYVCNFIVSISSSRVNAELCVKPDLRGYSLKLNTSRYDLTLPSQIESIVTAINGVVLDDQYLDAWNTQMVTLPQENPNKKYYSPDIDSSAPYIWEVYTEVSDENLQPFYVNCIDESLTETTTTTSTTTYTNLATNFIPSMTTTKETTTTTATQATTDANGIRIVTSYSISFTAPSDCNYWSNDTRTFKESGGLKGLAAFLTIYKFYANDNNQVCTVNGQPMTTPNGMAYTFGENGTATAAQAFDVKTINIYDQTHPLLTENSPNKVWTNEIKAQFGENYTAEQERSATHKNQYQMKAYYHPNEQADPDGLIGTDPVYAGSFTIFIDEPPVTTTVATTSTYTTTRQTTSTNSQPSADNYYLRIGDVTGTPGETVSVPVYVYNDPGTAGYQIFFDIDSRLTLDSLKRGNAYRAAPTFNKTPYPSAVYAGSDTMQAMNGSIVLYLNISIPTEIKNGETFKVGFYHEAMQGCDLKIVDIDGEKIKCNFCDGSIHVIGGSETAMQTTTKPLQISTTETSAITTTITRTTTAPPVKLDITEITLTNGEQYTIASNRSDVTYKSNNTDVAVVSPNGVITAVGIGQAKITVIDSDSNVAQITVEVSAVTTKATTTTVKETTTEAVTTTTCIIIASGECSAEGNNLTWTLDNNGTLTISGSGKMEDYNNTTLDARPPWYTYSGQIKNAVIQGSVTSIGHWAFAGCSHLKCITLPDSITNIGTCAFAGCSSLLKITIPDSVTSISFGVFQYCSNLTSVTIPDSVASIGDYAFLECTDLTNITLPDSLTSIGGSAFSSCSSLTNIPIPESVTNIGGGAFRGCSSLTNITIPDNVTNISSGTFSGCSSLTSITIPDSITNIGLEAFSGCSSLTSITVPDSVTSIGFGAFSGCNSLKSIIIPDSVTNIESKAFSGTPWLKSKQKIHPLVVVNGILIDGTTCSGNVTIPDSVTSIGDDAFCDCTDLTSITLQSGMTSIGNQAFFNCTGLTSITIPDSVTNIDEGAFSACPNLTIKGYSGSFVEEYAQQNLIPFESLGRLVTPDTIRGDVTGDGVVSVDDAQLTLKAYTERIAGNDMKLSAEQIKAADVNGDGEISVDDAQNILKYYTEKSVAGKNITWDDVLSKTTPVTSRPKAITMNFLSPVSHRKIS